MVTAALDSLAPTRRSILCEIKRRGEAATDELAEAEALTVSAVRQHLAALAADGLVAHRQEPASDGRGGRPRHLYRLTPRAHGLFPAAYGELTNELLGYFSEASPELVDDAFQRRRRRRTEAARARLAGHDFAGKVAELARILDEDGYLADFERLDDGTWRITEHNCAIFGVARRYGQACSSEIEFLREALPEADIERVAHMVAGAHMCSYRVAPRADSRAARRRVRPKRQ
ncbi:MAG TPA: ArsR family transcriptional regulator [Acidimicrobiales bacterium]|nr:ArsR family transcriptional regulator [Acidimicrobiales bacterium]